MLFITTFTRVRHLFQYWSISIQFTTFHLMFRRFILLYYHLYLVLPSDVFASGFHANPCMHISSFPQLPCTSPILFFLIWLTERYLIKTENSWSSWLWVYLEFHSHPRIFLDNLFSSILIICSSSTYNRQITIIIFIIIIIITTTVTTQDSFLCNVMTLFAIGL